MPDKPKRAILHTSARTVAFDVLCRIFFKQQECEQALEAVPAFEALEARDKAFAFLLVLTTLRDFGRLRHLAQSWMETPLPEKHARVMLVLTLGFAQIYLLKTPAHAAVHEMVELAKARHSPFAALVNALLNRAVREPHALDAVLLTYNVPQWLAQSWQARFGSETTQAMLEAMLIEPPLDITLKQPQTTPMCEGANVLANGTQRLQTGRVADMEGFSEGRWWVQDVSAALPAQLFSPLAGKRVLDMCAAPGGKTAQLIAAGADVVALDISKARGLRLQENLARLRLRAQCHVVSALNYPADEGFDAVLLDAPCSATGTIRRNPDVAWLKTRSDVERLSALQRRLLLAAVDHLKPGGELVYSVCSLEPEEGEAQIAWLLREVKNMNLAVATPPITPRVACESGFYYTPADLKEHGGMDGFFMAKLRKAR